MWLLKNEAFVKPQGSDSFITSISAVQTQFPELYDPAKHSPVALTNSSDFPMVKSSPDVSKGTSENEAEADEKDLLIDPRRLIVEEVVANKSTISSHGIHYFGLFV